MKKKPKPLSANKRYQLNEEMRIVARLYHGLPEAAQNAGKLDNLVVSGDVVRLASWTADYHSGAIRNYREREPKPGELTAFIPTLEEAWQHEAYRKFVEKTKSDLLVAFYSCSLGITRAPTNE